MTLVFIPLSYSIAQPEQHAIFDNDAPIGEPLA